ncbi:cellulose binding domain-containing protein [Actinosynnema sp. NPDC002837]
MRHLTRRLATAAAVAAMLTGVATVAAPAASAAGSVAAEASCRFDYTAVTFTGGFTAGIKVTNTGSQPVNGWWVEFDLSPGALIQTTYGGRFVSYSGHIRVNAPDWLPSLAPGRYTNVGFNGRNTDPAGVSVANVTLNDLPCVTG